MVLVIANEITLNLFHFKKENSELPFQKGKFRAGEGQIQVVPSVKDNDSDKELGTLSIS